MKKRGMPTSRKKLVLIKYIIDLDTILFGINKKNKTFVSSI